MSGPPRSAPPPVPPGWPAPPDPFFPPKPPRQSHPVRWIVGSVLAVLLLCVVIGAIVGDPAGAKRDTGLNGTGGDVPVAGTTHPNGGAAAGSTPSTSPTPASRPSTTPTTPHPVASTIPKPKLTSTPRPKPTPKPTPKPVDLCGAPANPWGFNFCGGSYIYAANLPDNVCSYFSCIDNFFNGVGYMIECRDHMYSMSGGRQGRCSYHGGEGRRLYR